MTTVFPLLAHNPSAELPNGRAAMGAPCSCSWKVHSLGPGHLAHPTKAIPSCDHRETSQSTTSTSRASPTPLPATSPPPAPRRTLGPPSTRTSRTSTTAQTRSSKSPTGFTACSSSQRAPSYPKLRSAAQLAPPPGPGGFGGGPDSLGKCAALEGRAAGSSGTCEFVCPRRSCRMEPRIAKRAGNMTPVRGGGGRDGG